MRFVYKANKKSSKCELSGIFFQNFVDSISKFGILEIKIIIDIFIEKVENSILAFFFYSI